MGNGFMYGISKVNKIGGNRNYGYGKQLAWAGKNALADRYGQRHYATRAAHEERWGCFVRYLKVRNVRDARQINRSTVLEYGANLRTDVASGKASVAYAQNLLSTVNIILQTMRKDTALKVSPCAIVGERSNVRTSVPRSYDRIALTVPVKTLEGIGRERVAMVATLARDFGLRFKEASLLNCKQALRQAKRIDRINITQGTKGGRGKGTDRWVPVSPQAIQTLQAAAKLQGKANNLIPQDLTYAQWRDHANSQWRSVTKDTFIRGFHDMRAAYACERYKQITGFPAPVIAGERLAPKEVDTKARSIIALALGHNRRDVVSSYIGSTK